MRVPELPSSDTSGSEENIADLTGKFMEAAQISVNYRFRADWDENARKPLFDVIAGFLAIGEELQGREGRDMRAIELLDQIGRDLRQSRKNSRFEGDPFWEAKKDFKQNFGILLGDVARKSFCDAVGYIQTGMTPGEIRQYKIKARAEGGPTPTTEVSKTLKRY